MANKNHQSAQLGMEQRILLYTTTEMQGFLDLHAIIKLFRERLSGKKSMKVYATRPKGGLGIHSNFAYWPRENLQVCIFARGNFVSSQRPPSVALLLLSHLFE